jgi:hypothetical protein
MVELLADLGQLLREPCLRVFAPLVKVELDLAESLEARNEIVVEDAKVREWLSFGLSALLLQQHQAQKPRAGDKMRTTLTGVLSTPRILSIY